ncbi:pectate lyase family protein [Fibrobacter succinogenes]|uniref:Pectate lyase n=1 Tax=Fibrobacter succinogenes TaxID=833 RepID=A0A380RVY3_FIBSU|nr:right-handed parallel beta-helix repeat-containing protein [Fibrobacter succinogenes]PWJ37451.1 pectate lyase [Fibrobacter succinogenes subsp. elongatus]SUQ19698.1 Pectate lyase [Fibrobacter succinogenes]
MKTSWMTVAQMRLLALLGVISFGLVACGDNGKVAGGTEAESTIALYVQMADGTPASTARVRILPDNYLSSGPAEEAWNETNEDGHVLFEVRKGRYTIEARNVSETDASGAVHSIALDAKADSKVDTIKLGELTSIEGYVVLGESPVVRVAGLDRYVVPDSTGHFVIDSLPQGSFDVQIGDPEEVHSTVVQSNAGDTLFVDGSDVASDIKVVKPEIATATEYPESDWSAHEALLKQIQGYATGTLGASGRTDSTGKIEKAEGEICIVTTTDDLIDVVDSSKVDSLGNYGTKVALSQGSFRECAEKETPVWILFEKDGTYNLRSPLRIKSDKTVDGRGRDIRITGMGILTNESSNLIFENLTFTAPAITAHDTTSRRALSIHNRTHHVWVDHCTFEEYPLILVDVKRGSNAVTLSWNRFENAQSGILFGLEPDLFVDSAQTLTLHHNYFSNLELRGVLARRGKIHAYNNFIYDVGDAGMECSDSASCYIEGNVYNNNVPVRDYRLKIEDGSPDKATEGYVYMIDNWFGRSGENISGDALGFRPAYKVSVDDSSAELAVRVRNEAGPR